jgi:outer membrane biosynthesis protein TonB
MRKGEFGAVLLEYSVASNGIPGQIVVLESTASMSLEKAATRLIKDMRCDPGKEWLANGGLEKRLKMNVLFQYRGRESTKPLDPDPNTDVVMIEAEPLSTSRRR